MISIPQNPPAINFITGLNNRIRVAGGELMAKVEFVFQNQRKDDPADDVLALNALATAATQTKQQLNQLIGNNNNENEKREQFLKEYVHGLEAMMFMTHHKVRQPVANILGMANLIEKHANSPDELKKIADYMKQSALDLDMFTRELTKFVSDLEQKGKDNSK
jgi:signal transduction histidine kinase